MQLVVNNLKALIVVMSAAMLVFAVAKPICRQFMEQDAFVRRRNVWLLLTVAAFVTPSFWLFAAVAVPAIVWATRRDSNPVALYLLLMQVIPQGLAFELPVIGINELFDLQIYRILSFGLLLPAAWRLRQSRKNDGRRSFTGIDMFLLAYAALHLILLMPYESITHTMRRGFLFTIDALLLYFVVSRTCVTRRAIVEAMACFCLVCAIFAPLAVFESWKGWLLYTGIGEVWGKPLDSAWLLREDVLRAQVAANHSIPLGYMMAIGFGFWLYFMSRLKSTMVSVTGAIWMWSGLIAAFSRAPWIVALLVFFAYPVLDANGSGRFVKTATVTLAFVVLLAISPVGERALELLPFIGTVDAGSVTYRQQLAESAWHLIKQNPFFGTPFVLLYLEHLRQGQGIIDLMNAYATIAMFYGLVGLTLFVAPFLIGMWKIHQAIRAWAKRDPGFALLGANLLACMIGLSFMLASGGFGASVAQTYWIFIGLAAAYAALAKPALSTQPNAFIAPFARPTDLA